MPSPKIAKYRVGEKKQLRPLFGYIDRKMLETGWQGNNKNHDLCAIFWEKYVDVGKDAVAVVVVPVPPNPKSIPPRKN